MARSLECKVYDGGAKGAGSAQQYRTCRLDARRGVGALEVA